MFPGMDSESTIVQHQLSKACRPSHLGKEDTGDRKESVSIP